MRNLLIAILVLLVGAVAGRWVLIQFYPNFAIAAVYYSMQQREKTPEGWLHVDPIDETSRTVVRPAYDLLYSVCNADLANSGYYISLPLKVIIHPSPFTTLLPIIFLASMTRIQNGKKMGCN